jgi:hypothetical protein
LTEVTGFGIEKVFFVELDPFWYVHHIPDAGGLKQPPGTIILYFIQCNYFKTTSHMYCLHVIDRQINQPIKQAST